MKIKNVGCESTQHFFVKKCKILYKIFTFVICKSSILAYTHAINSHKIREIEKKGWLAGR